jgi:peptidoglycan/LPS O-acetylase OafA/YrhL
VLGVSAICFIPTLLIDIYAHRTWTFLGILPVQALGFGLLLLGLSERPANVGVASTKARPAWLLRAVAFIGISSYSTYLWHWPFAEVLLRAGGGLRRDCRRHGHRIVRTRRETRAGLAAALVG